MYLCAYKHSPMHRYLCVCTSPHGYNWFGHPTPDTGTKNTSLLNFFVCSVYLFSIFPIIDLCKTVTCEFFAFFMCKMKNKSKRSVCSQFTSIYQFFFFFVKVGRVGFDCHEKRQMQVTSFMFRMMSTGCFRVNGAVYYS